MSTLPLSNSILSGMRSTTQSSQWSSQFKETRTFRSYCCNVNSNIIMGVSKQPVPIVRIEPKLFCVDDEIEWDLTSSYAPGSTITSWEIDFGDEDIQSGGPGVGTAFGTKKYDEVGVYNITVVIEEGLGKSQTVEIEVIAVDCQDEIYYCGVSYIGTYGNGVFALDTTIDPLSWEARNTGLSGDALKVNYITIKPGTDENFQDNHELWICTKGGVYRSVNSGGNWDKMNMGSPTNEQFFDGVDYDESELDWKYLVFDNIDPDTVYVVAEYLA